MAEWLNQQTAIIFVLLVLVIISSVVLLATKKKIKVGETLEVKKDEMFNIYYLNSEKAIEISMLFDNSILEKIVRSKSSGLDVSSKASFDTRISSKIPSLGQYIPALDIGMGGSFSRANRVEDTIRVVSSKSTILKPIYDKASVSNLVNLKSGALVKIKDVSLHVDNYDDAKTVSALTSGILRSIPVDGVGNIDLTSLISVLFKNYTYVVYGDISDDKRIMLKIPMSPENELESHYDISDLEIGKVTVLGIYRGQFDWATIESKTNILMRSDSKGASSENPGLLLNDIDDGVEIESLDTDLETDVDSEDKKEVHFIDVIAILQDISI